MIPPAPVAEWHTQQVEDLCSFWAWRFESSPGHHTITEKRRPETASDRRFAFPRPVGRVAYPALNACYACGGVVSTVGIVPAPCTTIVGVLPSGVKMALSVGAHLFLLARQGHPDLTLFARLIGGGLLLGLDRVLRSQL